MFDYLHDRLQIADLINGWIYRDLGQWDNLLELFHADGTIEITWYKGPFPKFVERSKQMGASALRTKHVIGMPVVTFNGDKCIVETNAMIIAENVDLALGCTVHNRFYDLAEKRDGQWKLSKRQAIYDMGGFNFPSQVVDIDPAIVARYPREYAALAYLLEVSGFPLQGVFATRGSALEQAIRLEAQTWLSK